tara:strand:+ start:28213 stop:28980 length:768 start_codon:yes stop_codon:yes gene_type:complete
MGILNLTPDSFYDGVKDLDLISLEKKVKKNKYADIIDVGAESTRPFSDSITSEEEIERLSIFMDIKDSIKQKLSIDSYKYDVIKYALDNGFNIINDISGGGDKNCNIGLAAEYGVPIIIMHMQGNPRTMQIKPKYDNLIDDILFFFNSKIKIMKNEFDLSDEQIIIDPGIGFGKSIQDNYSIIDNIYRFKDLGFPLLIGLSRKSFLSIDGDLPQERKKASLQMQSIAMYNGADYIRTHDVYDTYQSVRIIDRFKK